MRNRDLEPYRRRVLSHAAGRVLEVGVGSGTNLPLYRAPATGVVGLDTHPKLLHMARDRNSTVSISAVEGSAEFIPLADRSVDTIVLTWTLCSIPDPARALAEMRRVLRPNGQLLFVEHGLSPDASVRRWQQRLTPVWKRIAGGCHLDRPIQALIQHAGFEVTFIATGYMQGPRPLTFMYEGRAKPL